LAWAADSRWHIEECSQQAKNETGLDHYQVRTWRAWHAHVTLSMLALAWPRRHPAAGAPEETSAWNSPPHTRPTLPLPIPVN
jgi:SRSO17 transposase